MFHKCSHSSFWVKERVDGGEWGKRGRDSKPAFGVPAACLVSAVAPIKAKRCPGTGCPASEPNKSKWENGESKRKQAVKKQHHLRSVICLSGFKGI